MCNKDFYGCITPQDDDLEYYKRLLLSNQYEVDKYYNDDPEYYDNNVYDEKF